MQKSLFPVKAYLLIPAFFFSCKEDKLAPKIISALEGNLYLSTQSLDRSTEVILKSLDEKSKNPCTMERATIWKENASRIKTTTQEIDSFLNMAIKLQSKDASIPQNLSKALLKYSHNINHINSEISDFFSLVSKNLKKNIELAGIDSFAYTVKTKKKTETQQLRSILYLIQNDLHIIQNALAKFCESKIGTCGGFDYYSVILGQNSSILIPNSNLEIIAGVGAYSKASNPEITINKTPVALNSEGYILYRMKVNSTPGKYKVPVQINFNNPATGAKEKVYKLIEYTVADTCISLR